MPSFFRSEGPKFYFDPKKSSSDDDNIIIAGGGDHFVDPAAGMVQFPCLDDEASIYLSVVVPCMNEEERLPIMMDECLDYLENRAAKNDDDDDGSPFTYEVIVVDDGSADDTFRVATQYTERYGSERVRVLRLRENLGKGGAVRAGFSVARGRYLLFADADGATRFEDFEKLEWRMITSTTADGPGRERAAGRERGSPGSGSGSGSSSPGSEAVIVGSRAHLEQASIARRSLFRTVLMYGFHFLVWLFCVRTVRDTQCGFKLFSRDAARRLFGNLHVFRWAFDVEVLFLAERLRIPIREVAVRWHEVEGSKLTPWKASLEMARDLFLIWLRYFLGIWTIRAELQEEDD